MAETAANLVEQVLPSEAPLRQFVLTLPFELRTRLAYDGLLLGAVPRVRRLGARQVMKLCALVVTTASIERYSDARRARRPARALTGSRPTLLPEPRDPPAAR